MFGECACQCSSDGSGCAGLQGGSAMCIGTGIGCGDLRDNLVAVADSYCTASKPCPACKTVASLASRSSENRSSRVASSVLSVCASCRIQFPCVLQTPSAACLRPCPRWTRRWTGRTAAVREGPAGARYPSALQSQACCTRRQRRYSSTPRWGRGPMDWGCVELQLMDGSLK